MKSINEFFKDLKQKYTIVDENATHNYVHVNDLPLYPEERSNQDTQYYFVEDDPLPLQNSVRKVRLAVQDKVIATRDAFTATKQNATNASNTLYEIFKYLEKDGSVLAKAGTITIGGMAGFLWGFRTGGPVKQLFCTGIGLSTMTAFCYPYETIRGVRLTSELAKKQMGMISRPVQHPAENTESGLKESKDIDLYSTRSEKID